MGRRKGLLYDLMDLDYRLKKEEIRRNIESIKNEVDRFNIEVVKQINDLEIIKSSNIESIKEKNEIKEYYNSQKINLDDEIKKIGKEPKKDKLYQKNNIFVLKLLGKIFPKIQNKRLLLEEKYNKTYEEKLNEYNSKLDLKKKEIKSFNKKIENKEKLFENCDEAEVKTIIKEYLDKNKSGLVIKAEEKEEFEVTSKIDYQGKKLMLNLYFFDPEEFSNIPKSARFSKQDGEIKYKFYSENELNQIFESFVMKTVLVTAYNLCYLFETQIDFIVINCKVNGINPLNGRYEDINIFSVKFNKDELLSVDITNIDKRKFLEKHNARCSNKMFKLEPVKQLEFENSNTKYEGNTIESIDNDMDGFEFEKYSEAILSANGYNNIEVTKSSGDYGADVIAYKDEIKYAIQCKKYSGKVGVNAIQEVIASKSIYNCHVAAVLTNSFFTPNAVELAKKNNVILWDRKKLKEMLENVKENTIVSKNQKNEIITSYCKSCGAPNFGAKGESTKCKYCGNYMVI